VVARLPQDRTTWKKDGWILHQLPRLYKRKVTPEIGFSRDGAGTTRVIALEPPEPALRLTGNRKLPFSQAACVAFATVAGKDLDAPRRASRLLWLCLHFINMQRSAAGHAAADRDVLANLSRDRIRILDRHNFLVFVAHKDRLLAGPDALFGAAFMRGAGPLGAAFGVADPATHALIFWGRPGGEPDETQCKRQ
jgi:hypothetical protein